MKKVTNLAVIILTIIFMSCSCEKDDPIVPDTLETQFPDWVNLTWEATDDNYNGNTYPKLSINIVGNEVTVSLVNETSTSNLTFEDMTITGDYVVIGDVMDGTPYLNGTFINDEITIVFDVGNTPYYDDHTYVLLIN